MRIIAAALLVFVLAGPANGAPLRGKIVEALNASSYTYLRLATGDGEIWAAVPRGTFVAGSEVSIANALPMDGFESKALKRTFARIVFGTVEGAQRETDAKVGIPMDANHAEALRKLQAEAHGAASATEILQVPRASGPAGHTVAEILAQKARLKDTAVTVRGKVVKASANILGRNWLHLQDGSGGDLLVTTRDAVPAGEVVQASGALRLERDFGAGYRYDVILEDATISR